MNADRDLLMMTFLPEGREGLAVRSGALKGLRRNRSAEHLLRVLLLHPGCGHSLSETVVRARKSGLAALSPVALMKRLIKAGPWLQTVFRDPPLKCVWWLPRRRQDGSLWRIHYPVCVPVIISV